MLVQWNSNLSCLEVFKNSGTPKSSQFSVRFCIIINYSFISSYWGTPILGNLHLQTHAMVSYDCLSPSASNSLRIAAQAADQGAHNSRTTHLRTKLSESHGSQKTKTIQCSISTYINININIFQHLLYSVLRRIDLDATSTICPTTYMGWGGVGWGC